MRHVTGLFLASLTLASPAFADGPVREPRDFRGVWAGSDFGHCRWVNELNLVYDRRTAEFPSRGDHEPARSCRILSVKGQRPEWKLRLACGHADPVSRAWQRFEMHQTIRMVNDGYRIVIETQPVLGQPARTKSVYYCRRPSDPEPVLICFSEEKGHTVPCEP